MAWYSKGKSSVILLINIFIAIGYSTNTLWSKEVETSILKLIARILIYDYHSYINNVC